MDEVVGAEEERGGLAGFWGGIRGGGGSRYIEE